jgi:DNA-directed RNA polymerase specialized sigma subunit
MFLVGILTSVIGYLNIDQIRLVQSILRSPRTPPTILSKTKKLLCTHYYPWVLKETRHFTKKHRKIIRNIVKPYSIHLYAIRGLNQAIDNYNGSSAFHVYAKPYIQGELYRGLTDSIVLKPYTHGQIMKQKNISAHLHQGKNRLVSYNEYWTFDKLLLWSTNSRSQSHGGNKTRIETIREKVDILDIDSRKLFYLRYNYYDLSLKTPIAKICDLLCISQETYRKRMNHILDHLR